ncbi:MATE family efflux transporter [Aquimarina agarivorans]|uniref:MATE family efflux transporter n=1 Tax=Aquimarina agarivorans TaxID=980584 RepID=UPI001300C7B0|nr:MATE family efflux transporter [Aquimarina agarivorans]
MATIISQFPAILILIYHLKKEEYALTDYFTIKKEAKKESLMILKRVLPLSLEPISFNLKDLFIIAFIGNISSIAIASYTYSKNILIFLTTVLAGALGVTVQIFSSYSIGGKNYPQADLYMKKSINYYIPIVFFTILVVYIFSDLVFSIFTFNEEVLLFTGIIIPYFIFSETFQSVSLIISPTLRGVGDPKLISILSISSNWIFGVLSSFVFAFYFKMGLSGILLGILLDEIFRAGCNYVLWKKWINSKSVK